MSEAKFKPVLGLWDATMIVAGSMIGSGIFIVSADILRNVGGSGWLITVWLITGFMTISAAVSYGELSGMFPKQADNMFTSKKHLIPSSHFCMDGVSLQSFRRALSLPLVSHSQSSWHILFPR
jgi:APA family basic amino acid/polyamine antiporter